MITKDNKSILYKYEAMFNTAIKSNYVCGSTSHGFNELKQIYQEITGDMTNISMGCSHCVLQLYKTLGNIYFDSIKEEEEINKQLEMAKKTKANKK